MSTEDKRLEEMVRDLEAKTGGRITITDVPSPPSDPGELLEWLASRRYWLSGQHVEGLWSVHTGPNVILGVGINPIGALRAAYMSEYRDDKKGSG